MNKIVYFIICSLLYISCNQPDKAFEVTNIKTPFVFNHECDFYKRDGIPIDSTTLIDTIHKNLHSGKLYSLGILNLKDNYITLLVNENPTENWTGTFHLINYSKDRKPLSYLFIYDYGSDVFKTTITKDTIYKYVDFEYSGWVEKFIINNQGKFVMVEEKKVWADTTYNPN